MPQLRVAPSGPRILGNAAGDLLVWDGSQWLPQPGGAGAGCEPLSRTLYCDAGTATPLAQQDGSICAPFATITQAFAAAAALPPSPVTIHAAAGIYTELLRPPVRSGMRLQGDGPTETIVTAPDASTTFLWELTALEGASIATFEMSDISIVNGFGGRAIEVETATVFPDTAFAGGLVFDGVQTRVAPAAIALRLELVGRALVRDCVLGTSVRHGGPGDEVFRVFNCSEVIVQRSELGACDWEFLRDMPIAQAPALGRSVYGLADSTLVNTRVVLRGMPLFVADETVLILSRPGGVGPGLEGIGLAIFDAGGPSERYAPVIFCSASIGSPLFPLITQVLLPYPALDSVAVPPPVAVCDFNQARVAGISDISNALSVAARLPVSMRQYDAVQSPLFGASGITIGEGCDADLRGATFNEGSLSVLGTSTADRDEVLLSGPVVSGPSTTLFPYSRFPAAGTMIALVSQISPAGTAPALTIAAVTPTGVFVHNTLPVNMTAMISVQRIP